MPHVTFIVATYRRPDALRCTLRALVQQAHADWDALVIGDRCGPETEEAIRAIADPRVAYYNLPHRFGEQSGPNSAGLRLAEGDFVCFLNHDDLLLKDHLVRGLDRLDRSGADLYFGRFANVTSVEQRKGDAALPVIGEILPRTKDLRALLLPRNDKAFDPSSFWIVRTAFARAVGLWRPAVTLRRTPLCDWLLRAWRRGGVFSFGEVVTGIRVWTHNLRRAASPDAPLYSTTAAENEAMVERMEGEGADETRAFIESRLRPQRQSERPARSGWREVRLRLYASAYRRFGLDPVAVLSALTARPKGTIFRRITLRRVGEELPHKPTMREFLAAPDGYRVL